MGNRTNEHAEERILEDDYPVHFGYWYVVDGLPVQCELFGGHATVFELRIHLNAREIRNCDLRARGMLNRCVWVEFTRGVQVDAGIFQGDNTCQPQEYIPTANAL